MPQFVMCAKKDCPKSNECYRFKAVPDKDQVFNNFINLCNPDDEYRYHIKIRKDDKIVESKNNENTDNTEILTSSYTKELLDNGVCEES